MQPRFLFRAFRGPGAVLAVVLPLMPLQEQMQPRKHENTKIRTKKKTFSFSCFRAFVVPALFLPSCCR
jgi:hypothetical protein